MIVKDNFSEMGEPIINISINYVLGQKPKETKKLKTIVIGKNTTNNIRYLTVPIQRFACSLKVIILDNEEYSIYRLLDTIYKFYNHTELSLEDLKNINDDDVYDYITTNTNTKKETPESKIYYINLMGDKKYFENICKLTDNSNDIQYYLLLGS